MNDCAVCGLQVAAAVFVLNGSLLAAIQAPFGFQAAGTSPSHLQLRWSYSGSGNGFQVERLSSSGAFVRVASLNGSARSWVDTGRYAATSYSYRIRATKGNNASGYVQALGITAPLQAPIVTAGLAQTVTLPSTATVKGLVEVDGIRPTDRLTVQWSMLSGPGLVTFANADVLETVVTFSLPGVYILRLTATVTF